MCPSSEHKGPNSMAVSFKGDKGQAKAVSPLNDVVWSEKGALEMV